MWEFVHYYLFSVLNYKYQLPLREREGRLTLGKDGVEVAVTEARRCAAELWAALATGDLQVTVAYPLRDPAQAAVTVQEAPA